MQKIPTMFERDWLGNRALVTEVVTPGCEWVLEGEGVATRKYDGTCVMFDGLNWWGRREVKAGRAAPAGFMPVEHDNETGKSVGWEPIEQSPFAKFFAEVVAERAIVKFTEGTYELCGRKVNGNPERIEGHLLIRHDGAERYIVPRTFEGIRDLLSELDVEGFVFHHEDGRMAKIKGRDFGLRRGA